MNQLIVRNTHQKWPACCFLVVVLSWVYILDQSMLPAHLSQLSSGFGNCSCVNQDGWWEATILGWYENFNKTCPFPCQPTATPPNPSPMLQQQRNASSVTKPAGLSTTTKPKELEMTRQPANSQGFLRWLCSYDMVNTLSFTNVFLFLNIWSQIMHSWVNPPVWTLYLCIFHPIGTKKRKKTSTNPSTLQRSKSHLHWFNTLNMLDPFPPNPFPINKFPFSPWITSPTSTGRTPVWIPSPIMSSRKDRSQRAPKSRPCMAAAPTTLPQWIPSMGKSKHLRDSTSCCFVGAC